MVYFADDLGHCSEMINLRSELSSMYYSHIGSSVTQQAQTRASESKDEAAASKEQLIFVTTDAVLYKYSICQDGKMSQDRKVSIGSVCIDIE